MEYFARRFRDEFTVVIRKRQSHFVLPRCIIDWSTHQVWYQLLCMRREIYDGSYLSRVGLSKGKYGERRLIVKLPEREIVAIYQGKPLDEYIPIAFNQENR